MALQILNWEDAGKLVEEAQVYDVKQLEGRPCVVESEGLGGIARFKRIL